MSKSRVKRIWQINQVIDSDIRGASEGRGFRTAADVINAVAARQLLKAKWNSGFENVYRVFVNPDTHGVEVICLGVDSVDSEAEGTYPTTSSLPTWMQEKLAVLVMMKVATPNTKVEGVGMRISEDVFWVIKGEGE